MKGRPALVAVLTVAAATCVASPARADAGGTQHALVDPTGEEIRCASADLVITGGTLAVTWSTTQDEQGIFHLGGTNVPRNVTLTDGNGNTYSLAGASHFTGRSMTPAPDEPIAATDVDHFVIRTAAGQPLGTVQLVVHLSPNGNFLAVDSGTCELVEDE